MSQCPAWWQKFAPLTSNEPNAPIDTLIFFNCYTIAILRNQTNQVDIKLRRCWQLITKKQDQCKGLVSLDNSVSNDTYTQEFCQGRAHHYFAAFVSPSEEGVVSTSIFGCCNSQNERLRGPEGVPVLCQWLHTPLLSESRRAMSWWCQSRTCEVMRCTIAAHKRKVGSIYVDSFKKNSV